MNVAAGETCDDDNTVSGDGCDAACQSEVCTDTLSTPFNENNGFDGNMFDVVVLQPVTIDSFDVNCDGTNDLEIYYKTGTWVGSEGDPGSWTLIGSVSGVVCNPTDTPTPLDLDLNLTLGGGQTVAFYVTTTGGSINYTNGTAVGATVAQDTHLQILEGWGGGYPFGSSNTPRVWNGTIVYCR